MWASVILCKQLVISPLGPVSSRAFLVEQSTDFGHELHEAIRILFDRRLSAQLSPPLIFLHRRASGVETVTSFSGCS
jgi:hypothetical protein